MSDSMFETSIRNITMENNAFQNDIIINGYKPFDSPETTTTMVSTGREISRFLLFFQFLVSRREIGDEKREIDFLHFLPNFGQILVLFEDFSKHNQHFRGF